MGNWFFNLSLYLHLTSILCLTSRTTVTSARIPEEDACHRARNVCAFSRIQKGTPGLMHKWCILQRVSLGAGWNCHIQQPWNRVHKTAYCQATLYSHLTSSVIASLVLSISNVFDAVHRRTPPLLADVTDGNNNSLRVIKPPYSPGSVTCSPPKSKEKIMLNFREFARSHDSSQNWKWLVFIFPSDITQIRDTREWVTWVTKSATRL